MIKWKKIHELDDEYTCEIDDIVLGSVILKIHMVYLEIDSSIEIQFDRFGKKINLKQTIPVVLGFLI